MIDIKTRVVDSRYLDVQIEMDGTRIDLGLLDEKQQRELASDLATALSDVVESLGSQP